MDDDEEKRQLKELLDNTLSNKAHTDNILKKEDLKDAFIYCKINRLSGQFTGPAVEKWIAKKKNMTKNSASDSNGDLQEASPVAVCPAIDDEEYERLTRLRAQYSTYNMEKLKAECRRLGLKVSGNKGELLERLMEAEGRGSSSSTGNNHELKASNGGTQNDKFNFVQIRMNHQCDYIFMAYYISYENLDNKGELFIFKLTKTDIIPMIDEYGGYAHRTKKELGDITIEDLNDKDNMKEYDLRPKYGSDCWKELLKFRVDEI